VTRLRRAVAKALRIRIGISRGLLKTGKRTKNRRPRLAARDRQSSKDQSILTWRGGKRHRFATVAGLFAWKRAGFMVG